ncbi:MAG: hypothetical protein HY279_06450 [Nitrospinae bacterium]|nr:hypothetical protein [Nitrospinota bacterium]
MSYAIKIYEAFKDDEVKAKVLSEAIEKLEERYFHVENVATVRDLENESLRLKREIKETELILTKEIEKVRQEIRETELKLTKEIEKVRLDLTKEIMDSKQSILRWLFGFWVTQATFVIGVIWVLLKIQ